MMKPISPLATFQSVVDLGRGVPLFSGDVPSKQLELYTMPDSPEIPSSGPLPVPSNPDEARLALKAEAFEAPDVQTVRMVTVAQLASSMYRKVYAWNPNPSSTICGPTATKASSVKALPRA